MFCLFLHCLFSYMVLSLRYILILLKNRGYETAIRDFACTGYWDAGKCQTDNFHKEGGNSLLHEWTRHSYCSDCFKKHYTLSIAPYKGDKACAISYTFDDGLAEQYSLVAPQFEKRGFRGTFAINGSKINSDGGLTTDTTRMSWEQVKDLSDRGHEISNHGWKHKNFARFPLEEIREDIYKNDSAIFANTGVMPRTFVYPNNNKKEEAKKIAVQNRVGTRTKQRSIGSKSTPQNLEAWVNTLIETNDWG